VKCMKILESNYFESGSFALVGIYTLFILYWLGIQDILKLISTKHVKVIRYNDTSVLENHHCTVGFKLLMDPQNDIFETLSEAQSWNVRQIIINMILATDISNHFEQLLAIQNNKKFPDDNKKDKQALMNILLYTADHAAP